ncbi:MAG: hypothetical protein ABIU30_18545 [Ferruginibacter sp.]
MSYYEIWQREKYGNILVNRPALHNSEDDEPEIITIAPVIDYINELKDKTI